MRNVSVLLAVLAELVLVTGCTSSREEPQTFAQELQCIGIPAEVSTGDKKQAVEVGGKLEGLPELAGVQAKLKTEFTNAVKTDYAKIESNELALYIFLSAIDCYTQPNRGAIGEEMARELMSIVKARWAARANLAGTPADKLTPVERSIINKSPLADEIYQKFSEFGVK